MRIFLILLFLTSTILIFAQERVDTIYFDNDWRKSDSSSAAFISYYIYSDTEAKAGTIKSTSVEGRMISECSFSDIQEKIREGICIKYHENGNIKSNINYSNDKYNGELKSFYPSGKKRRVDFYDNGVFNSGNYFTESGEDSTHFPYMQMPEFPGGMEGLSSFLAKNIKYPKKARKNDITGKVYIGFIIDTDGNVINEKIDTSVHPLLDEEALRVVRLMPKWKPGIQEEKVVKVYFSLPIGFKLID